MEKSKLTKVQNKLVEVQKDLDAINGKIDDLDALYHFDAVKILSKEEAARAKSFGHQFMEILNVTVGRTILPQADNPLRI